MPEVPQSEDPLPSRKSEFDQRVENFHRATAGKPASKEITITDTRDPFAWYDERSGINRVSRSQYLYNLMWAAYRLVGTLPSEDEVKFRDLAPMDPKSEEVYLHLLSPEEHAILADYHKYLVEVSVKTPSITQPEVVTQPIIEKPRSRKEEMLAAIFEHMDILKLQQEPTQVDKGSTSVDIS